MLYFLLQEFHVAYVVIKTANSPRPGMWILEKSANYGQTYTPWYYFAPSRSECIEYFGINPRIPLEKDDQVLCTSEYSEIPPLENGEMHISLVNGRPSALKNQFSPELRVSNSKTYNKNFFFISSATLRSIFMNTCIFSLWVMFCFFFCFVGAAWVPIFVLRKMW